jgi:glycerol-3-phosphate acyltransferase PlsY
MLLELGFIILSYLIGSVSTAIVLCKATGQPDPRTLGSGNPGATNVLRFGGKRLAAATLIGDVVKGLIPVLIAKPFVDNPTALACVALAAVIGHVFPVYYRFKGGKGVATGLGVLLGVSWQSALAALAVWLTILLITRLSSLAAIIGAILLPLIVYLLDPHVEYTWFAVAITALLLWRHRQNINNLLSGRESKVGESSATKGIKPPTED